MEDLVKENETLKKKLRDVENDRDEIKMAFHIVTVHCCHLIGEKEGKKVEDVYKEISERVNNLLHMCA